MLNDVRIGKIQPIDIERVDSKIGVIKLPVVDIDESLNPLTQSRIELKRSQTSATNTRSKSFDMTMTKTNSDSNLKTLVKTFFNYNHKNACNPNKNISDSPSLKSLSMTKSA